MGKVKKLGLFASAFLVSVTMVVGGLSACTNTEVRTTGCFGFAENLFSSSPSSDIGDEWPYVFHIRDESIQEFFAESRKQIPVPTRIHRQPVAVDVFSSAYEGGAVELPDLSLYTNRYQLFVQTVDDRPYSVMYQMDSEFWFVHWGTREPARIDRLAWISWTCE